MPAGQVAAVGVVPDLVAVAEDVQRVLALEHLLHEVGTTWLIASFTLPLEHLDVAEGPALADADAVERPHDRVGQLVLVPGGPGEVLDGQLLEAVGRQRRRDLRARRPRTDGQWSVDSNTIERAQVGDLLQPAARGAPRSRRRTMAAMIRSLVASRS